MNILGISAFYHDSAAALVREGEIVAAAQEERFTRAKNTSDFPTNAIRWCLESSGLKGDQIDFVAFYDKPFLKFERLIETYFAFAPRGFTSFRTAMPIWISEKLFQKDLLLRELNAIDPELGDASKLMFSEHHLSHAASAFYPSPFDEAAILTLDGVGEWSTTTAGTGQGSRINIDREIHFPHSIGLLYAAFTYYTGFKVNADEYKVMGLAPYGEPRFVQTILNHLIDLKPDGSFRIAQKYFDYCTGLTMTNANFDRLFGGPPRRPEDRITQREMDLAASIQAVTEEVVLRLSRSLACETGMRNLCLAGGVALNCVANGKLLRDGAFENIWIQPAAGDAGGAIGAALVMHHLHRSEPRRVNKTPDGMKGAYLGPEYTASETRAALDKYGANYRELDDQALFAEVTSSLIEEKVVGWFQGRMEFGPRALGNRSILGDARSPRLQRELNLRIKYRESFRPFAPAVPREDVADYFEIDSDSPYMLQVAQVRKDRTIAMSADQLALQGIEKLNVPRSDIPAVTHIDYSARVQTVHLETNPRFHRLLREFQARTGSSVLVNTSFNVRDEPVVCSPEDAYRCFMNCEMDVLVIGNFILRKEEQLPPLPSVISQGDNLFPIRLLACLKPPGGSDESSLERISGAFRSPSTGAIMPDVDGIPSLLEGIDKDDSQGVTGKIKAFYEENPFPSYEGVQEHGELVNRGQKNRFARGLLDAIGHNKLILECGCGTGQMSQFLSLNNNHVLGIDLSRSSLRLALEHKVRNGLQRSAFALMNIFDLAIKDDSFDVVLSSGVLHHTKDARRAFASIVRKAKPGGIVIVGLYNTFGRLPTLMRSKLIGVFGANIDSVVRNQIRDKRKAEIWVKDQYYNPHETWHSIDDVIAWFAENNVDYLNCYPSIMGSDGATADLLSPTDPGSKSSRLLTQLSWLTTTSEEGALFIVSGRRRGFFIGIGLLLIFIAVEIQSYAFGKLSIANGNSFQFYQPNVFDLSPEQLANESTAGPLGWQSNAPRPQSSELSPSCGSAFGDSMTHGDEVKDDEAWLHRLSERLGCNVQNFGVGGYGLDQAVLRYEMGTPPGKFVILGLFIEMLRRDMAASWTFYRGPARNNMVSYSVTKPMFVMASDRLELVPRPTKPLTRRAIVEHHRRDFFLKSLWTQLSFPYSYAAGHAIYRRYVDENYLTNLSSNQFWQPDHPSNAVPLAEKILVRMRDQSKQRKQQLVVVMIPQVEESADPRPAYAQFVQDLARRTPDICIVDTHAALAAQAAKVGTPALKAPLGHYSPAGSEVLAQAVREGLQKCGIAGT